MPLIETKGAASAQGFGLTLSSGPVTYIEDVFSTYLYTGNGSTQTITNGIDLSGKGGLVWIKGRSGATDHALYDTTRGATKDLVSNSTAVETTQSTGLTAFNGTGFSIGALAKLNTNAATYVSWTFRKQPKFFDIVTWTGNGTVGRTIAHNLGSTPGCIIVKATNNTTKWVVWHRSGTQSNRYGAFLNDTSAYTDTLTQLWGATGGTPAMTSTSFSVGDAVTTNDYFNTYVAYVFAHNAGGFGLSGTDNVISCGSFTTDSGGNATVNLGYEAQWLPIKQTGAASPWYLVDVMRGWVNATGNNDYTLSPNTSAAEALDGIGHPTATGFDIRGISPSTTWIYIAIRRGPMKVPTSGTSVFKPVTRTGTGTSAYSVTGAGFSPDSIFIRSRNNASGRNWNNFDRLRGIQNDLIFGLTNVETNNSDKVSSYDMGGYSVPATPSATLNASGENFIDYLWKRAPNFMDVVCYTGTGSATTFNHNLGVAPELVIVKWRSGATGEDWAVMCTAASSSPDRRFLYLDLNAAGGGLNGKFANSSGTPVLPTATQVYIGTNPVVNNSAATYVAYLFATCPGVSKVGSYTGNGSSQTINCGFTGGARFVLIKRTDSTGDWYVWDTARGIVAGNDPYLGLNTYVNEVTTNDTIDPDSTGFIVNQLAATNINVSSATYIFLAIA